MRRQRRSSAGRGGQGGHRPTHRARTDHVHLCQPQPPPPLLLLVLLLVLVPVVVPLLVLVLLVLVLVPLACCCSLLDPSGLVPSVVRQSPADDTSLVGCTGGGLG